MALFNLAQVQWDEPVFFVLRLRTRKSWMLRGVCALVIALIMLVAIIGFDRRQRPIGQTITISLLAGVVLTLLPDVRFFQRNISINKEDVTCFANAGHFSTLTSFPLKDIQHVQLIRPEAFGKSYGAMVLQLGDSDFLVAVPAKVSQETVANILHRLGVRTTLAGWEPSDEDTRVQVKQELDLRLDQSAATNDARIWAVDADESKLTPPMTTAIGITIALGPLLIALLSAIGVGIFLFIQWRTLSVLERSLWGIGAFAGIVVSFVYLVMAGQFLASRYQVGVAKQILRTRPNAQVDGDEDQLNPVETYDRDAWTSMVTKSTDFGFLKVDTAHRLLKFEGNKNRWLIPATALTACRIEEAHVGSEANENAEKRYYVVISVVHDGQPWEAGMLRTRTTVGADTKEHRLALATALMKQIQEIVPSGSR